MKNTSKSDKWKLLKRCHPVLISGLLIAWVIWSISDRDIAGAVVEVNWFALIIVTIVHLILVYLYDGYCLAWLFRTPGTPLKFRDALHIRGFSYLLSIFHYGLGQGMVAWQISRLKQIPIVQVGLSLIMLAYVDLCVLLSLGLVFAIGGWLPSEESPTNELAWIWGIAIVGMISMTVVARCVPKQFRLRLQKTKWGAWLGSWEWDGSQFFTLFLLRVVHFSNLMVFGLAALWMCDLQVNPWLLLSALPMVALANTLPSVFGLGTREAALIMLIPSERPEILVAFSLLWSTCTIACRAGIGLCHFWYARAKGETVWLQPYETENATSGETNQEAHR